MKDLDLIPTQELIEELNRRFDHWVFSGAKVGIGGPEKIYTTRKWNGNSHTCVGLCGMLQVVITDGHLRKNELEEEDSEP